MGRQLKMTYTQCVLSTRRPVPLPLIKTSLIKHDVIPGLPKLK